MDLLFWKTLAVVFLVQSLQEMISVEANAGCIERSLVGKNHLNIPNSSFTASSYLYQDSDPPDKRYMPYNARLNGQHGWAPRDNYNNDYLQIDLGVVRVITAVATQGNGGNTPGRSTFKEWVTRYKLQLKKDDSSEWVEYVRSINKRSIDSDTICRYNIPNTQMATYIRFVPIYYESYKTMRVNVYVINQEAPRVTATPSERSILLHWTTTPCIELKQSITGFIVNVTKKGVVKVGYVTSYNITGLQPYIDYEVRVKAAVQYGLWSEKKTIKTTVAVPEVAPIIISHVTNTSTSIVLEWKVENPRLIHGLLTGYRITYTAQGDPPKRVDVGVVTTWTLTSLEKYTWYTVTVSVKNTKYFGPKSKEVKIITMEDAPSAPSNVKHLLIPNQGSIGPSLRITWDKPLKQNGVIRKYTLIYYYNNTDRIETIIASTTRTYMVNITMMGVLLYSISASTIKQGPYKDGQVDIPAYPPWAAPSTVSVTLINTTTIDISWRPVPKDKANCNITKYEVKLVAKEARCNDALNNKNRTIFVPVQDMHVVLQDLLTCSLYGISVRGYTRGGHGPYSNTLYYTTNGKSSLHGGSTTPFLTWSVIVGLVVALFLLLIVTLGLTVILWKCRTKSVKKQDVAFQLKSSGKFSSRSSRGESDHTQQDGEEDDETKDLNSADITPLLLFDVTFVTPDGNIDECSLKKEFRSVPTAPRYVCTHAEKPTNKKKNRYKNIVTYDHSRVILKTGHDDSDYVNASFIRRNDDPDTDYINASFLRGYDGLPKAYIATQGPLPETTSDFWRMVWQQNTATIVMLTNLIELRKIKCHQYWPEGSEQYGDITVTTHQTRVFADYVIRTFFLAKHDETSRRVRQFHFTAWPDKGVPQHATAILAFRRKVHEQTPVNAGPTVIHCSAGVGRTGAYVMIDAMLQQAKHQQRLDIFSYLQTIRDDRPFMVQTEDQYIFVHLSVYEALSCGNTEIQVHKLSIALKNLSMVDKHERKGGFALEFQRLRAVTRKDADIVDERRVILSDGGDDGKSINASFVDTYRERNAFIVTQAPLENTVGDFWRMVLDYEIGTIVMLNNVHEGDETFPQYWPERKTLTYGSITVKPVKVEYLDELVERVFQVMDSVKSLSVVHLQHTGWANRCIPSNPQGVLELLNEVEKSQQKLVGGSPVLVQCSNGIGRSGTFCAIASTLERVKQEQVLDVFQTVKSIRTNRPGAVETLIQYKFCYTIIQNYLDSFSDYSNFKE